MRVLNSKKCTFNKLTEKRVNMVFNKVKEIYPIISGIDYSRVSIAENFIIRMELIQ